jgi:hypothetical protein
VLQAPGSSGTVLKIKLRMLLKSIWDFYSRHQRSHCDIRRQAEWKEKE